MLVECRIALVKTDQFIVACTEWNMPEWELNANRNLLLHICVRGFLFNTKPNHFNPYETRGIPLTKPRPGGADLISRDLMFLSESCKQPTNLLKFCHVFAYIFGYGSF